MSAPLLDQVTQRRTSSDDDGDGHPSLSTLGARGWQVLGVLLATGAVLWVLSKISLVVVACLMAVFVAALLRPASSWLVERGVNASLAALLVVVGASIVVVAIMALIGLRFAQQAPELLDALESGLMRFREQFPQVPLPENGNLDRLISSAQEASAAGFTTGLRSFAEFGAGTILTAVLVFFLLRDGRSIGDWFVSILPHRRQPAAREIGLAAHETVGRYVKGLVVVATADAVLSAIALVALGVPLALPLTVLTFLAAFIPTVGAIVVGALAVAVAFASEGPIIALAVGAAYTAIQQIDGNVLHPWIMGHQLPLHPASVVLALTLGGLLAGVVGALLGVPILAAAVAASRRYHDLAAEDRITT